MDLNIHNKMYDQLKVLIEKCTKLDYIKRLEMTVVRSELEKIQRSVYAKNVSPNVKNFMERDTDFNQS